MRKKIYAPGLVRPVVFPYGVPAELGGGDVFLPVSVWSWSDEGGNRDFGAVWVYDFVVPGCVFSWFGGNVSGADNWTSYIEQCPGGSSYVVGCVD